MAKKYIPIEVRLEKVYGKYQGKYDIKNSQELRRYIKKLGSPSLADLLAPKDANY